MGVNDQLRRASRAARVEKGGDIVWPGQIRKSQLRRMRAQEIRQQMSFGAAGGLLASHLDQRAERRHQLFDPHGLVPYPGARYFGAWQGAQCHQRLGTGGPAKAGKVLSLQQRS